MRRGLAIAAAVVSLSLLLASGAAGAARLYIPGYGSGPPEGISGFARSADGSLSPLAGSPFAVGELLTGPSGVNALAFAPDGRRAVTTFLFSGGVLGLTASGGSLAPAQAAFLTPSVTGAAVSPDGRFAYAPTREFNAVPAVGILGYSIGPDGMLTALSGGPFGSGTYEDVAITPDGRFLYTTGDGQIVRFAIGADGGLTELGTTPIGANSFEVSPDGRFLFAGLDSGVASFSIEADGSLDENGTPALTGSTRLGFFAVAADGRHIYMPDSNVNAIVTASVAADGTLSVVGSLPLEFVKSVGVSPDGRFLYYARPDKEDVGVAAIGADGLPALLPGTQPWDSGEAERFAFQPPGPAPTARFGSAPAAAGSGSRFDAGGSVGAARYDWSFGDGSTAPDGGSTPTHTYASPGNYEVRLTVVDSQGCSTSFVYTGQSTVCPGGSAATQTARLTVPPVPSSKVMGGPTIHKLWVAHRRFAVAPTRRKKVKRGTAFLYTISEVATATFTIESKRPGRVVAGKCKRPTAKNRSRKRCPIYRSVGKITAVTTAGLNSTKFSGRLRGKKLPPGSYRATAVASDSAGAQSAPRSVAFEILPG